MEQTLTLADFLLARIAEDEALAQQWSWVDPPPYDRFSSVSDCDCGEDHASSTYLAVAPLRVLAECAAKRTIVEEFVEDLRGFNEPYPTPEDADLFPEYGGGVIAGLRDAVRALAAVYADHPDYRAEWAVAAVV